MNQESLFNLITALDANPIEVQPVSDDRRKVIASVYPDITKGEVVGVLSEAYGEKVQHLVHRKTPDSNPEVVIIEAGCKIFLEDLSPTQLVEYKFPEGPEWYVARMSAEAAINYRGNKFKYWKNLIDNPSCEQAYKRMLKTGVVTHLFDPLALPTPEALKDKYTVVNDEGKKIELPHPVEAMRIWNAEKGEYVPLDAHLEGAPKPEEVEKYWNDLLEEQYKKHGQEYILKIMNE